MDGGKPMKFIHISDIHIGARPDADFPWGNQREKEIFLSFQKIIDICNSENIDLLLIAGDLFHKQPLLRELKEVNYCFEKLVDTKVVLIAGNHDHIGSRSNYVGFNWSSNVFMLNEDSMDSIYLEDINTEVYGFSYHTRDITESRYDQVEPGCEERINILLAHGGDEKNIPMNKKAMQSNGFDYIALGHIHKPEIFSDRMAYSGSLEPLDKNETGDRGYIQGEIMKTDEKNTISLHFVPNSFRKYYKEVLKSNQDSTNGSLMDEAKKRINELGEQNLYVFYISGIRDTDIIFHKEDFFSLGNVIDVIDETVPDYDFDALFKENSDNMIGLYIQRIKENAVGNGVAQKALYYGIEALLGARR
jgi:DNA repair protein SbcD/Mre11